MFDGAPLVSFGRGESLIYLLKMHGIAEMEVQIDRCVVISNLIEFS